MSKKTNKAADLFAGAGGATAGLKTAGFKVVAAFENDVSAIRSYVANHPEVWMFPFDLGQLNPTAVLDLLDMRPGDLSLLTACPPCQGFSTLGSQKPFDERNDLVEVVWRFARVFRPAAVVLENVPGLTKDRRLAVLLKRLRGLGYGARCYVEDAADFGVPQRRQRLIVLALYGMKKTELPPRLSGHQLVGPSRSTVRSALSDLSALGSQETDPLNVHRIPQQKTLERIRSIPEGGDRFDLPRDLQLNCHAKLKSRTATAAYGRMKLDQPSPTLTTRCTTPACGSFLHPTDDRGITLREAAVLQSFPLRYRFEGSYGAIERQIGNAVPVKMIAGVGAIVDALLRGSIDG